MATEKQIGMVVWRIKNLDFTKYLKERHEEFNRQSVDYTITDFENWLEDIDVQETSNLIERLLEEDEEGFDKWLQQNNY